MIDQDQMIFQFHKDKKYFNQSALNLRKNDSETKDKSSQGTISSADEKDMELLFCGAHTYQFQAVQRMQVIQQEKEKLRETEEKNNQQVTKWQKFKDFITCRRTEKKFEPS